MASDIEITSLTATPAVGGFALFAEWAPPAVQASLPYMQAASVVFYASATDNFGAATVVGESPAVGLVQVGGVGNGVTRYVWAQAKDPAGNLGDRFPSGGGVAVTTLTTAPGPNSVGPNELQNGAVQTTHIANLAVTSAKILSLAADKITAGVISALVEILGPTITGGLFRTAATGNRVEISGATQMIRVINSGNAEVARLGVGGTGVGSPAFAVSGNGNGQAAIISGATSSQGLAELSNTGNSVAVLATTTSTSNNAHAIRARNIGAGGGEAVLGVSSGGGGWALNAQSGGVYSAGGYQPFTGMHEALALLEADIHLGDLVSIDRIVARDGLNNVLAQVSRTEMKEQRGVIGVVSDIKEFPVYAPIAALGGVVRTGREARRRRGLARRYRYVTVNALGEGQMTVCGMGGDIELGDFIISSSLSGVGERLDMNLPVTFSRQAAVVAQAMEPLSFDSPHQIKTIACFYRCG